MTSIPRRSTSSFTLPLRPFTARCLVSSVSPARAEPFQPAMTSIPRRSTPSFTVPVVACCKAQPRCRPRRRCRCIAYCPSAPPSSCVYGCVGMVSTMHTTTAPPLALYRVRVVQVVYALLRTPPGPFLMFIMEIKDVADGTRFMCNLLRAETNCRGRVPAFGMCG